VPRPTPRFFGALAVAVVVFYYAASSEVAWLFLLAYWVGALIVASFFYALWNRGLRGELKVGDAQPGPGSPRDELPEQVLRAGPLVPLFEGDRIAIDVRLSHARGARGPARMAGTVAGTALSAAAGVVPKGGWSERKVLGPARRGPVGATGWVLDSSDVLGFFKQRTTATDGEVGLVLPRFMSLSARPHTREVEASLAAPRAGSGSEVFGVREYRPGDPLRRIHWRSSARHAELIVREFEPPGVQTLGILCDPDPPSAEAADQIARLAASEAWDCLRVGGRVIVWSPGCEPSRPEESRSLWAQLEWLARYHKGIDLGANAEGHQARSLDLPASGEGQGGEKGIDLGANGEGDQARSLDLPAGGEGQGGEIGTRLSDAVVVTSSPKRRLLEEAEMVRRRGGSVRAWVVGDVELDLDVPTQRAGLTWPL
jgi:uncharacterized protein (DUF58 family)